MDGNGPNRCESIEMNLLFVLNLLHADADAIVSSQSLCRHFNKDEFSMQYQDSNLANKEYVSASQIVTFVEEALYVESLLCRAHASECGPDPAGEGPLAAHHRDALATLLNASFHPTPLTLPAVVCAVGYVLR